MKYRGFAVGIGILLALGATVGYSIWEPRAGAATSEEIPAETATTPPSPSSTEVAPLPVSVITLSAGQRTFVDVLGTVRARDQATVVAPTAGQVGAVHVEEGMMVTAGDVLFEINGVNGTPHPSQAQLALAEVNYQTAVQSLELTLKSNEEGLKIAVMQRDNALSEAKAAALDQEVFSHNILNAINTVSLLDYSLQATRFKNDLDADKQRLVVHGIEKSIRDTLDDADKSLEELESTLEQTTDPATKQSIRDQIEALDIATDAKLSPLKDSLKSAKLTLQSLTATATLAENQLHSQIQTAQTQAAVLQLNKDSVALRNGLRDESTNALRLAEETVQATVLKNAALLTQVQAQVEAARISLQSAKSQESLLKVRSPLTGIIGPVLVHAGDTVGQTTPLTQVVSGDAYELVVPVDIASSTAIDTQSLGLALIGGSFVPVPIKSVSPIADSQTKFVNVVLTLPRLFVRANQSLSARIPLRLSNQDAGAAPLFIPLDAVTIGTEEQFVYIVKDGRARKQSIQTGAVFGDQIEVLSGLNRSDEVVLQGAKSLSEGQTVTIVE